MAGLVGENPGFNCRSGFVLSHYARKPLVMAGGTTFHFVTEGAEVALARALDAADGRDIRVGGGVQVICAVSSPATGSMKCTSQSPDLLGSGERLFDGIDLPALGYSCSQRVATPAAIYSRIRAKLTRPGAL